MKLRYHAVEYKRGHWHVIGPSGLPLYDDAPHGNDKPFIFRDEDVVLTFVERCNVFDG
jgi:hypothetical protein